ncbi:TetR/AcrR family transcriptional regulator [Nocardia fluminea]|uniref:TetR/AcrR family transcriptional regulator n=1 Tax=Nocardia fluminea TaxID=134984 RepID=UPI00371E94C9
MTRPQRRTPPERKDRAPRQDRSTETRRRLLDATIESLAKDGWAGTGLTSVADRAGLSRGAAQHHFGTRDELVEAALDHLPAQRIEEIRERGQHLPDGPERLEAVVDLLCDIFGGALGVASLQLWVGASTDPQLGDLVRKADARFNREIYQLTLELLGFSDEPENRRAVQATLVLVRGFALDAMVRDDKKWRHEVLQAWLPVLERGLA